MVGKTLLKVLTRTNIITVSAFGVDDVAVKHNQKKPPEGGFELGGE